MSEIRIAKFGFGAHYDKLSDGIAAAHSGDTLKIRKASVALDYGMDINKTLYIEGEGKDRTTVFIAPNSAGLAASGGVMLSLSHLTLILVNQCNAITLDSNFYGRLVLDDVRVTHKRGVHVRDIYPSLMAMDAKSENGKRAVNRGSVVITDSDLDIASLPVENLSITRSQIGEVVGRTSRLISPDLRLNDVFLSGTHVVNLAHSAVAIDRLASYGGIVLDGSFKVGSLVLRSLSLGEGFIARRAFKRSLDAYQAASQWFFVTAKSSAKTAAVQFQKLSVDPALVTPPEDGEPLYQTGFLDNEGTEIEFIGTKIPAFPLKSRTVGGSLMMENVEDTSDWTIEGTQLSRRGQVKSQLFAAETATAEGMRAASPSRALDELDRLTGLDNVKSKIHQMVAMATMNAERKRRGLPVTKGFSLHMIFAGNAGTGKTTVARLFGRALYENGVLASGKFVEASRKDLVAGYIGQTAPKTHKVVMSARGGVLFIDEAYSLASQGSNDFADEAVSQLIADMENYRDDLVVILAGYTEDMQRFIREGNQGLKSRFANWVEFADYTIDELIDILNDQLDAQRLIVDSDETGYAMGDSLERLAEAQSSRGSGNGRFIRNYVQALVMAKDTRLSQTSDVASLDDEALLTLTQEDVAAAEAHLMAQTEAMGQ